MKDIMKVVHTLMAAAILCGMTGDADRPIDVLVFTKTSGDRHDSIPAGVDALERTGARRGWNVQHTEDGAVFSDDGLADLDVVVFLNTSGPVLNQLQQAAFERFIEAGNGFVGIHGAADTGPGWPWYQSLVGATESSHAPVQEATYSVEDRFHPATLELPLRWRRVDAPISFDRNPRAMVNVVISLDETSYRPGTHAMGDHPIAWYQEYENGRAFYTGLGHTSESYDDELFLAHLAGAIFWASGSE